MRVAECILREVKEGESLNLRDGSQEDLEMAGVLGQLVLRESQSMEPLQ